MTGLAPQRHAVTGWHMYFRELGTVLAVLPFRPRHGGPSLAVAGGVTPAQLLGNPPLADRLDAAAFVVSPAAIVESGFNTRALGPRAPHRARRPRRDVRGGARRRPRRPGPAVRLRLLLGDRLARARARHRLGARWARSSRASTRRSGGFLEEIAGTDTLVIATADHGFVDTRPETVVDLDDHPELAATLARAALRRAAGRLLLRASRAPPTRFERYVETRLVALPRRLARRARPPRGRAGSAPARRTRASPSASATTRSS